MAGVKTGVGCKAQERQLGFKKVILVYARIASRRYGKAHVRQSMCA
jgi:hypothetical protein